METRAQFHQLGARRKLQKARLFYKWRHFANFTKMVQLFEVYALRRVVEIGPSWIGSTNQTKSSISVLFHNVTEAPWGSTIV